MQTNPLADQRYTYIFTTPQLAPVTNTFDWHLRNAIPTIVCHAQYQNSQDQTITWHDYTTHFTHLPANDKEAFEMLCQNVWIYTDELWAIEHNPAIVRAVEWRTQQRRNPR